MSQTPPSSLGFSGSYHEHDIRFLLQPSDIPSTPLSEKEANIQSGRVHYSDMLSHEAAPSVEQLAIYHAALAQYGPRLAREVIALAKGLQQQAATQPVVLISLVRAGVPLGVMLQRSLTQMGHEVCHYGISIVRDRGIDSQALSAIEARHPKSQLVFVDGWSGKGAIRQQLADSLQTRGGYPDTPRLLTLADPAGVAWMSASHQDWLIPFSLLGACVSGLVSRSLWSETSYHRCVLCESLRPADQSLALIEQVRHWQASMAFDHISATLPTEPADLQRQRQHSQAVIQGLQKQLGIDNINRIKPSLAEATRAVMRRVPERIYVRRLDDPQLALLTHLAAQAKLPLEAVGDPLGPYRAVTIIKKVG